MSQLQGTKKCIRVAKFVWLQAVHFALFGILMFHIASDPQANEAVRQMPADLARAIAELPPVPKHIPDTSVWDVLK